MPAQGKVINMDSVVKPEVIHSKGERIPFTWPKKVPGQFTSKEDARFHFSYLDMKQGLNSNLIAALLEDREGKVWIATPGGLSVWDGSSFSHFTSNEGLVQNGTFSLFMDRYGKIWIGTVGSGLYVWDGSGFTHYTSANGLSGNSVYNFLEDRDGKIWIGTQHRGISVWDPSTGSTSLTTSPLETGGGFTHYTTEEGLNGNLIQGLLEDRDGNIWIGTWGGGVNLWDWQV